MTESQVALFAQKSEHTTETLSELIDHATDGQVTFRISDYGDWWRALLPSTAAKAVMSALDERGHDYDYE